jgi:receptor protein-tyrosine kinase
MGRILETLRHPQGRPNGTLPRTEVYTSVDGPDIGPSVPETISFIEVGPQRSMEASADVLATLSMPKSSQHQSAPSSQPASPEMAENTSPGIATEPAILRPSRLAPELISYHQPRHQLSQQYDQLLRSLLVSAPSPKTKVLLFSGARPGCGTTTVLLNLGITAALHHHLRVVVVDGNQRRPNLAKFLELREAVGLRDVLTGGVSLDQAIQETDQPNLFALSAGAPGAASGMRYVAETLRSLLRQLRKRFDLVLVDGPRWDGQPDVVLLGSACDGVYLVVSESEVESPQVDELYQSIPEQGAVLAGCILAGC